MKNNPVKSLVVGYGSIGRRHEEVLRKMGAETAVISRHAKDICGPCYSTLQDGMSRFNPRYVVVANRTSEHLETLNELERLGFNGTCLVEKPLADVVPSIFSHSFTIGVGYVLRFHPLIQKAKELLAGKRLLSVDAYAGQYLPDWRPGTDYRQCYSAIREQGGGVLRDLSHELDYIALLAGVWRRVSALGGHLSELEIDTEDVCGLLMEMQHCPAVLCQINYLDRNIRRDCTIQYEGGTLHFDLIANRLVHNGVVQNVELERNDLFEAMHTAALTPGAPNLCSFAEAVQTMELIQAAEKAMEKGCWVCRTENR